MFPDAEEVADQPVEEDIPQGFTFGADSNAAESFDLNIDVTAGSIEVNERDDIPILEDGHEAA